MNTEKLNLDRFGDLVSEKDKLASVYHTLSELKERKQRLEVEATKVRKFDLRDQAEMVIDGTYNARDFLADISKIDNEIAVHEQAVHLQSQRLDNLKRGCSKKICDEVQGDYRKVVGKMRDAANSMIAAIELEAKFIDELQRHDIDISYLGRVFFPRVLNKDSLQAFIGSTEQRKGD
jgi:hypothetical protein